MINDRSLMVSLDPRDRAIQNKKHLIIGKKHEYEGKYINLRMWTGSEDMGKSPSKAKRSLPSSYPLEMPWLAWHFLLVFGKIPPASF